MTLYNGACNAFFTEMQASSSGSDSQDPSAMFSSMCRHRSCFVAIFEQIEIAHDSKACQDAGGPGSDAGDMASFLSIIESLCAEKSTGETCFDVFISLAEKLGASGSGSDTCVMEDYLVAQCCAMNHLGCCFASIMANEMFADGAAEAEASLNFTAMEEECPAVVAEATRACSNAFEDRTYLLWSQTFPGCEEEDQFALEEDLVAKFDCPAERSSFRSVTPVSNGLMVMFECDTTDLEASQINTIQTQMSAAINPTNDLTSAKERNSACGGSSSISATPTSQRIEAGAGAGSSDAFSLGVSGLLVAGLALF